MQDVRRGFESHCFHCGGIEKFGHLVALIRLRSRVQIPLPLRDN